MGYRMIHSLLFKQNIKLSLLTVHRYMKEMNLKSIVLKRKPTYLKAKKYKIFKNILNRNFHADKKNIKWCTDFTYIKLSNGSTVYNCSILDLYDRSIVASLNGRNITSELAIKTLQTALEKAKPSKNLILHSDQGVQFTSKEFVKYCSENKIKQSMSKAGCPFDNSPMESFYGKMKLEHLNNYKIKNLEHLNFLVTDYVFRYYNYKRPHSYNNGLTPFEKRNLNNKL